MKKMLLETQMRSFTMTKGEDMEYFLFRLQLIRDQLIATGAKVEDDVMVRTALNAVTNEWETFVQSILGQSGPLILGQLLVNSASRRTPQIQQEEV